MSLHHFYWNGRERSVSIDRQKEDSVTLRFIDPEIINLTGSSTWQIKRSGLSPHTPPAVQEVIAAIEERLGQNSIILKH